MLGRSRERDAGVRCAPLVGSPRRRREEWCPRGLPGGENENRESGRHRWVGKP